MMSRILSRSHGCIDGLANRGVSKITLVDKHPVAPAQAGAYHVVKASALTVGLRGKG